ncbi:MAG: PTS transporter subunit EIIB, partial [Solobacterium sp.]|nr:PTS transporter subunit EIIB [Solobacterium sp.]
MAKYTDLCSSILEQVGGKENVTGAFHCMTRLRLTLRDKSKVNADSVRAVKGVLGTQFSGDQFQIVIGPTVPDVYREFCELTGIAQSAAIDENLDAQSTKKGFDLKSLPSAALDYLSGSVAPVLPIMLGAGFFRMFYSMLGPDLLKLLPVESQFMQTLNFVGNLGFYFLPVYIAWSAARKRRTNVQMALVLGCLLIAPEIIAIVSAGQPFSVYGILPMQLNNYSQAILPPLFAVWALSYVYPFIEKITPKSVRTIGVPFLTLAVMVPLTLCLLAPIGNWIGTAITKVIGAVYGFAGPVAVALIGALWMFMIATGMHIAVIQLAIINMMTIGN